MFQKSAILFFLLVATPAVAWACPNGFIPLVPMDYLMVGVTAAVGYRLLIQPLLNLSKQMNSAIYLSCLIASFGAGAIIVGEFSLWPGFFGFIALFLAFVGAINPKNWMIRFFVLLPVFVVAFAGSFIVLDTPSNSEFAHGFGEADIVEQVVF